MLVDMKPNFTPEQKINRAHYQVNKNLRGYGFYGDFDPNKAYEVEDERIAPQDNVSAMILREFTTLALINASYQEVETGLKEAREAMEAEFNSRRAVLDGLISAHSRSHRYLFNRYKLMKTRGSVTSGERIGYIGGEKLLFLEADDTKLLKATAQELLSQVKNSVHQYVAIVAPDRALCYMQPATKDAIERGKFADPRQLYFKGQAFPLEFI